MLRILQLPLLCLVCSGLFCDLANATTVTFNNAAAGDNADIALNYGSNITGNATGFVTTDGSGATPNVGLTWLGNIPNEWEYHAGSFWNHESPVHVLQMDHGAGVPPTDNIAEVVFSPEAGRAVTINSFLLVGASDQTSAPQVTWEVVGTGISGSELVTPGSVTGNPVNVGFTGVPGQPYTLRFMHVPGSGGSGRGTVLDDLSFSESLLPGVPELELTIDRSTGAITLTNIGSTPAAIKGYSISSEAGSMNQNGWRSIADNYDASGNQSVDSNDNWTELPQAGAGTDLSEFEFGGNGGTIGVGASVVLSQAAADPNGIAWLKSPFEDVQLEVSLVDTANYSGATPEYSVQFIGGPAGGYQVADLNFDNTVNALDWPLYNAGRGTDLSNSSQAVAYQSGDFNGDLKNDIADFVIFRNAFIAAQGTAAWAALTTAVPEPNSILLMVAGVSLWCSLRASRGNRRTNQLLLVLISFMACSTLLPTRALATTFTFALNSEGNVPNNNNDLNQNIIGGGSADDYGSNIAVGTPAFITDDGTGATPNIGVQWGPLFDVRPNVFEFHSGSFWSSLNAASHPNAGAPYLQIDVDGTPAGQGLPDDPTIDFQVPDNVQVDIHGLDFAISNTSGRPPYGWTVEVVRSHDDVVVDSQSTGNIPVGTMTHLDIDFLGDKGTSYYLRFDDGGEDHTSTAIDNLSFSELVNADNTRLKLIVDQGTGQITLQNNTGEDLDINSYEISSASGSLNPDGWNSLRNAGIGGTGAPDTGQGWDLAGGVGPEQLIESYLLGESTIVDGTSPIDLGTAYAFGNPGAMQDLKFGYHIAGTGGFLTFGDVEYVGSIADADFDNDLDVDGSDFLVWQRGSGTTGTATNTQGDANGDMNVDALDLAAWQAGYGAGGGALSASIAVPEPSTATLLVLSVFGACFGLRSRRNDSRNSSISKSNSPSLAIAAIAWLACISSLASADTHLDRSYLFGDGSSGNFEDSESQNISDRQDLEVPFGMPSPSFINVNSGTFSRAGTSSGDQGVQFNGASQVLTAIPLNRPDETIGPTPQGAGQIIFSYPYNYDTITARGLQMWVYPESAGIGTGRQGIVMDTIAAGGVAISADGMWTQSNDTITSDDLLDATVPVVGDQWHHVMQHIHLSGTPNAPRILEGDLDRGFTSVVYVAGVAVSANNGEPAIGEFNDGSRVGVLSLGAEEVAGNTFESSFDNFFDGVIDDLEMYVYGDNSFVTTSPAGQDYGTFDLFADNNYISDQISQIPNGGILRVGDINRDGNVNSGDEIALRNGWMNEKSFSGAINEISVGDWETWAWGDLNTDGIVNLDDAIILDGALVAAGATGVNFEALFTGVPEPSNLFVSMFGLLIVSAQRTRQQCH